MVDDCKHLRKALERLLRSAGMDVETFPSGAEFLDAMRSRKPDCLVLDLHMPEMDGFEVQSRLAQSGGTRLPVVVITADDTPESHRRALVGGAAAYVLKPIDEQVLLDAIAAAISKQDC